MDIIIPYKRGIVTLNKLVINYLPRCTYHILYSHIIFVLAPCIFLCSHKDYCTFIVLLARFYCVKTNIITIWYKFSQFSWIWTWRMTLADGSLALISLANLSNSSRCFRILREKSSVRYRLVPFSSPLLRRTSSLSLYN